MTREHSLSNEPEPRSAIAIELRALPGAVRKAIGLPDIVLDALDAVVATMYDLLDEAGDRTLEERFEGIPRRIEQLFPDGLPEVPLNRLGEMSEEERKATFSRQFARFLRPGTQGFLKRLLGSAASYRLKVAIERDWSLALLGSRRLLRSIMPIAQALQDAAMPLSDKERETLSALNANQTAFLNVILQLDELIGSFFRKRDLDLGNMGFPVRNDEATSLDIDLDELVKTMRVLIDVETELRAAELSDTLLRKVRGFEQALNNSDDGIAQAATSLVEFIDRLLRTAFTDQEVLDWVSRYYPDDKTLTYRRDRDGRVLPTKRGQAMCFAYAGQVPAENSTLEVLVAVSLVKVRNAAEHLKHADQGTPEEEAELRQMMQAVRGAMTFIFRFSWLLGDDSLYADLQHRFATAA